MYFHQNEFLLKSPIPINKSIFAILQFKTTESFIDFTIFYIIYPIYDQIPKAVSSKYIRNLNRSPHLYCQPQVQTTIFAHKDFLKSPLTLMVFLLLFLAPLINLPPRSQCLVMAFLCLKSSKGFPSQPE